MIQFSSRLKKIFDEIFSRHTSSVSFKQIWAVHQTQPVRVPARKRPIVVFGVVIALMLSMFTVGYTISRNIDKTDYPFVDDQQLIGKWQAVDFVREIELFDPNQEPLYDNLFLTELVFIKEGKMLGAFENDNLAYTSFSWTKDLIISKQEGTASAYVIKEINGETYLLFQWKSGDYVFRNMIPWYYVLKKVDNEDYSDYQIERIREDETDFPFEDDLLMHGTWESVDFVSTADSFKPDGKSWLGDLFLVSIEFDSEGKVDFSTTSGQYSHKMVTWTKGMILNKADKTASHCTIKEINGSTYMFYEWKSGDYVFRGRDPKYYVLKKVE